MDGEERERTRAAHELARQLGRVLAAYRLYPDDPEQPGFVAAVERVRDAAEVALAMGAVRFEVRSGALYHRGELLTGDEQFQRLVTECFERRVEELVVRSLPDAGDLRELARVLSLPVEEVADQGGVEAMLDRAGVWSIAAGEMRPDPEEREAIIDALPPELADLFLQLDDPERAVSNLLVSGLHQNPAQAAQDIYGRFGALHDSLPDDVVGRSGTLRRMRQVLDLLPDGVRREFFATVVTQLGGPAFPTNYVNHLTDPEVVDHLLQLGREGGPDVAELAATIVGGTGRPASIVPMLAERLRELEEDGEAASEAPSSLQAINEPADPAAVRTAVADALGDQLVDEASADLRQLRELYPATEEDLKTITRLAFRDYVRSETRPERLERALTSWVATTREALRDRDRERLSELLELLAVAEDEPGNATVVARTRAAVPSEALLAELIDPSDDVEPLLGLLEPFADGALPTTLDLLADEEDRGRRAFLVGLAVGLATEERLEVLTDRLDDDRWFVVRNLVTILGRLGYSDAAADLIPLIDHPNPSVRREVVRALVQTAGSDAVVHLRYAADDRDPSVRHAALGALPGIRGEAAARALADIARQAVHHDDQQRAIELLAAHSSPRRAELLRELASRRSKPRLPRSLRRVAKRAAKDVERGS